MNTIDFIKAGLEGTKGWASGLINDMVDAPLQQPTSEGGNHPLWVLGHVVYSEGFLLEQLIQGKANRFEEWGELFGPKSTPSTDADKYPSMSELFGKWEEIRAAALAHLDTLCEEDLDQRSNAPEDFGPMFATVGGCLQAMITHPQFHAGQVADARRAAGKAPLFM